jgi:hypothetical protein
MTNPLAYSDLVCNYVAERLQLAYYQVNFIAPIERCAQEGLDVDLMCEHIPESPSAMVNWFDRPSSAAATAAASGANSSALVQQSVVSRVANLNGANANDGILIIEFCLYL